MTIEEIQELVGTWNAKNGIRQGELTGMAVLTEKVGELARAMAQRHGESSSVAGPHVALPDELGEVLWALLSLAAQTNTDLNEALIATLEKKNSGR